MAVPKRVRTVSYNWALLDGLDSIFLGVNHTLSDLPGKKRCVMFVLADIFPTFASRFGGSGNVEKGAVG